MRLVIQRVKNAEVEKVDGTKTVGKIKKGLFILLGIGQKDSLKDAEDLAEKVAKLRLMADKKGKMNLSVTEVDGEFLVVSQFTLYGDTSKGNRPSFVKAKKPSQAKKIYLHFVECLKEKGVKVETGSFGDYMKIKSELDGPVTIVIET